MTTEFVRMGRGFDSNGRITVVRLDRGIKVTPLSTEARNWRRL